MLQHRKIFRLASGFLLASFASLAVAAIFVVSGCTDDCEELTTTIENCPEYKPMPTTSGGLEQTCTGAERARASCFLDNVSDICAVEFNPAGASKADTDAANKCTLESTQ